MITSHKPPWIRLSCFTCIQIFLFDNLIRFFLCLLWIIFFHLHISTTHFLSCNKILGQHLFMKSPHSLTHILSKCFYSLVILITSFYLTIFEGKIGISYQLPISYHLTDTLRILVISKNLQFMLLVIKLFIFLSINHLFSFA